MYESRFNYLGNLEITDSEKSECSHAAKESDKLKMEMNENKQVLFEESKFGVSNQIKNLNVRETLQAPM